MKHLALSRPRENFLNKFFIDLFFYLGQRKCPILEAVCCEIALAYGSTGFLRLISNPEKI